jgi:hypothetical protein
MNAMALQQPQRSRNIFLAERKLLTHLHGGSPVIYACEG